MNVEFIDALEDIEKEKGVSKEVILEANLRVQVIKNFGSSQNVEVEIDKDTGKVNVYTKKAVVDRRK